MPSKKKEESKSEEGLSNKPGSLPDVGSSVSSSSSSSSISTSTSSSITKSVSTSSSSAISSGSGISRTRQPLHLVPSLQEIPKSLHFIWLGGPLPEKYINNIIAWQKNNPLYKINLWIDRSSVRNDEQKKFEKSTKTLEAGIAKVSQNGVAILDVDSQNTAVGEFKLKHFYHDEITGQQRNLAAASDMLRLQVLKVYGGVYIDTDLPPTSVPLGTLRVEYGFAKSVASNDFMIASSKSPELVAALIDGVYDAYAEKLARPHVQTHLAHQMHRDQSSHMARTDTTLEWSGPDIIKNTIHQRVLVPLDDEAAETAHDNIFSDSLSKYFYEVSDQTWRYTEPKKLQDQVLNFNAEYNSRLRHCFRNEIMQHIEAVSNSSKPFSPEEVKALKKLADNAVIAPPSVSLAEIIKSWKNQNKNIKFDFINDLQSKIASIEAYQKDMKIDSERTLQMMKYILLPQERYQQNSTGDVTYDLVQNFGEKASTIEVARNLMQKVHSDYFASQSKTFKRKSVEVFKRLSQSLAGTSRNSRNSDRYIPIASDDESSDDDKNRPSNTDVENENSTPPHKHI